MRICGKRASDFTQTELWLMAKYKKDLTGKALSDGQVKEIKKVYDLRKENELYEL